MTAIRTLRGAVVALPLALLSGAPTAAAGPEAKASEARFAAQCLAANLRGGSATAELRCVGLISIACMNGPDGDTTAGQSACLMREAAAWDTVMRDSLAALETRVAAHDAASDGAAGVALDASQAAWAAYAEAECDYARALWAGGSFREVAAADCVVNVTARRAIQLRAQFAIDG